MTIRLKSVPAMLAAMAWTLPVLAAGDPCGEAADCGDPLATLERADGPESTAPDAAFGAETPGVPLGIAADEKSDVVIVAVPIVNGRFVQTSQGTAPAMPQAIEPASGPPSSLPATPFSSDFPALPTAPTPPSAPQPFTIRPPFSGGG